MSAPYATTNKWVYLHETFEIDGANDSKLLFTPAINHAIQPAQSIDCDVLLWKESRHAMKHISSGGVALVQPPEEQFYQDASSPADGIRECDFPDFFGIVSTPTWQNANLNPVQ